MKFFFSDIYIFLQCGKYKLILKPLLNIIKCLFKNKNKKIVNLGHSEKRTKNRNVFIFKPIKHQICLTYF